MTTSNKCSKCNQKPLAFFCEACIPSCGYCYSCHNRFHDEINVFHPKKSINTAVQKKNEFLSPKSYRSPAKEIVTSTSNVSSFIYKSIEVDNDEKNLKEKQDKLKNMLDEERQRSKTLSEELKRISEDFTQQDRLLTESLRNLKIEYENKVQEFEKHLKSSTQPILQLQKTLAEIKKGQGSAAEPKQQVSVAELKNEIDVKTKLIQRFQKGINDSDMRSDEVESTLQKILESKAKIVEELITDNQQKDHDIGKLHEYVTGFKNLFDEMNVEKEMLIKENDHLAEELDKARQTIIEFLEKAKSLEGKTEST